MKLVLDRCPLVVAGAWNQAIFTPDSVREKLFNGVAPIFEIGFSSHGMVPRFVIEGRLAMSITSAQLHILPRNADNDTLNELENVAKRALQWLPETPVTGFGVNFAFEVPRPSTDVVERLFDGVTSDIATVGAVEQVSITRKVRIDDHIVNIIMTRPLSGAITIDTNHHYNATDARVALKLMSERACFVSNAKDKSVQLIANLYGLRLEDK